MSDAKNTKPFDGETFARLHGLERLSPGHVSRLAELAPKMAEVGGRIPRPLDKSTAPAERSRLLKAAS